MNVVSFLHAGVNPENGSQSMYFVECDTAKYYVYIATKERMLDELLADLSEAVTLEIENDFRIETMGVM